MQAKQTQKKEYYHFSIYKLEFFFEDEVKNKYYDESFFSEKILKKTWINHSCYKKIYSKKFTSYQKLKKFLIKNYRSHYLIFYPTLNEAIKNTESNYMPKFHQYITTIYCSTNEKKLFFQSK